MEEKERIELLELITALQYWNRGDSKYLEEMKINLVGRHSFYEKKKEYLKQICDLQIEPPFKRGKKFWESHRNGKIPPYQTDKKIWESNRIEKILRANIGDFKRLNLLRHNFQIGFIPAAGEWEYFWQKSDELLKKEREKVGIKNRSDRPTLENSKVVI